jgi:3-dehydroquinate synthase
VTDLPAAEVLDAMRRDKKVVAGRLHMVLPRGLGDTVIVDDVTEKETRRALKSIGVR